MKLITRQLLANEVLERWRRQYPGRNEEVATKLLLLGSVPNPDAVDAVIGNGSWTSVPKCDDCGKGNHDAVMEVGAEPDYESNTATLCVDCLRKAFVTLTQALGA